MKHTLPLALIILCSNALAADFGLGVSLESNSATTYVPIQFGRHFRLEPFYHHRKDSYFNNSDLPSTVTGASEFDSRLSGVGVGTYYTHSISEDVRLLAGIQLAYMDGSVSSSSVSSISTRSTQSESDGYEAAPIISLEYLITSHVTIAVEASWRYGNQDSTTVTRTEGVFGTTTSASVTDFDSHRAASRIIFRFFF